MSKLIEQLASALSSLPEEVLDASEEEAQNEAYVNKEEMAQIRKALKKEFPQFKMAIKKSSSSSTVDVTILQGKEDFSYITRDRQETRLRHGQKEVTFNFNEPNEERVKFKPEHVKLFDKMFTVIKTSSDNKWFDKSDSQTDYFFTAFYIDLSIGTYGKPYVYKGSKAPEWSPISAEEKALAGQIERTKKEAMRMIPNIKDVRSGKFNFPIKFKLASLYEEVLDNMNKELRKMPKSDHYMMMFIDNMRRVLIEIVNQNVMLDSEYNDKDGLKHLVNTNIDASDDVLRYKVYDKLRKVETMYNSIEDGFLSVSKMNANAYKA